MTLQEISRKDVIQMKTGDNLGRIDDITFSEETAQVVSVILRGRKHFFGLLGRDDDLEISWQDIEHIGTDVVMVKAEPVSHPTHSRRPLFF